MSEKLASGMMVAGHRLSPEIMDSLKQASAATGVDFDFLVAQASVESGLKSDARSHVRHSTAAGIFQFTSQTWLQMVRDHGEKYGLGDLAHQIVTSPNGHLGTASKAVERHILALRKDVRLSGILAGELAKENEHALEKALHHKVGAAELHLAHLLGATGAIRFLKARQADAAQPAAKVVPVAARQNPSLFFAHGDHTPHSVAAVYGKIKKSIETPLKQMAAATEPFIEGGLRPGPGVTDALPRRRGSDRV